MPPANKKTGGGYIPPRRRRQNKGVQGARKTLKLEAKLDEGKRDSSGNGLGVAAFVISLINLLFILALSFYILSMVTKFAKTIYNSNTERIISLEKEISFLRAEKRLPIVDESGLSLQEKDMLYQAVRGTDIAKQRKIGQGREIAKMIWSAVRDYYNENGEYPPAAKDIFGAGSTMLKVSPPPGTSYFRFDVLRNGEVMAAPNTSVDASLGDVSNICVDCNGYISGGIY